MNESLPADVAEVLAGILNGDTPVRIALRRQIPHLLVRARCTCGCGTAYFELDTSEVEPAPTGPGTVVAAEAQLVTEAGECPSVLRDGLCLVAGPGEHQETWGRPAVFMDLRLDGCLTRTSSPPHHDYDVNGRRGVRGPAG
ncbi:hypothetical protein [Streptomyces sp. NPDC059918]|uniref:hypothetical protein n=1 Tax=unclassified Streptomyces TaxID=2593676 RepID=UPI00365CDA0D